MALEIKQSLRLSQQLVVTPQLQQAIKLLQLSRIELQNLVQKELLENPVLEEKEDDATTEKEQEAATPEAQEEAHEAIKEQHENDKLTEIPSPNGEYKEPLGFEWENYIGTFNAPTLDLATFNPNELPPYENMAKDQQTLCDHLLWQLHLSELKPEDLEIATEIVGNINDEGYLATTVEELAESLKVPAERIAGVLKIVQSLDPPGVGARTLVECLKIQADMLGEDAPLMHHMIENHLPQLEKHNYEFIAKEMGISTHKVVELAKTISSLEPKPGRPFGSEAPQYIIPDVFVHKLGNDYVILLNDEGLPRLQISHFYRNTMQGDNSAAAAKQYIEDKVKSAMWLIRSIHQRQRTLYKVATSIIKYQREFFEHGIASLRPMVLKDIAEDIQMHESTISRVTSNKYMHTPRGLFELKYFFNTSVPSLGGEAVASETVKMKIRQLIAKEDARHPLSDHQIAVDLRISQINIARRTVAKYREVMGILPSSKRRRV